MQKIKPVSFDFCKPNQALMENNEDASAPCNLKFNPQITFHLIINSLCPK